MPKPSDYGDRATNFFFFWKDKANECLRNYQILVHKELDSPVEIFVISLFPCPQKLFENMPEPLISQRGERSRVAFVLWVSSWGLRVPKAFVPLLFSFLPLSSIPHLHILGEP